MSLQPVLINGKWRPAAATGQFNAEDPAKGERLSDSYPVSAWSDCDEALTAAAEAAAILRETPASEIAKFLNAFANRIEAHIDALATLAHRESGLPVTPRLASVELPRTTNQLRQAAAAAAEGSWAMPTIDTKQNLRSCHGPLGPVCVFGPNNFPFAFNSVAGGDFAAAIAAGNPVIGKANTSHPGTTQRLAELAFEALAETSLPKATVQLLYRMSPEDGIRFVADPRLGATAYTGSRNAGLKLKTASDAVGKPIYLELSSINPVLMLPRALEVRGAALAEEFTTSCLLGCGQFCTNPGLVIVWGGEAGETFIADVTKRFAASTLGPLLSKNALQTLSSAVETVKKAGAQLLTGGQAAPAPGYRFQPTLFRTDVASFLRNPHGMQTEMFGPASLLVVVKDAAEAQQVFAQLEGSLTAAIYSDTEGGDDELYAQLAPKLRAIAGRLLNDRMPTGVAVSPAMNHGGPFPATGHPGFTAVGIPASLRRFSMLHCYDHVRPGRLPSILRDNNPNPQLWRLIDGRWTHDDVRS